MTLRTSYTIPLCDIIHQIWDEGHPNQQTDLYLVPSYRNVLSDIETKVDYARSVIFSFSYDYYGDASDKQSLEKHILKSYFTREICCDSVARWMLFLSDRMHDIMPKYKAIYDAQVRLLAKNYLEPYGYTETKQGTIDTSKDNSKTYASEYGSQISKQDSGNESNETSRELNAETSGSSTSASSGNNDTITTTEGTDNIDTASDSKYSDTPQALAQSNLDYLSNMTKATGNTDETYDSNVASSNTNQSNTESSDSSSNSTKESLSNSNTSLNKSESNEKTTDESNLSEMGKELKAEDYTKILKGNLGKYSDAELFQQYKDVVVNIEQMISNELKDLFYLVY